MIKLALSEYGGEELVFHDDFTTNRHNWEILDSKTEFAAITDNGYEIENKSHNRWTYYKMKLPLTLKDNFNIRAFISVEKGTKDGECGLVWGFNKSREILNRFAIANDLNRCTIKCFQRSHERIYHAYNAKLHEKNMNESHSMEILHAAPYYIFRLNGEVVYIVHETHFSWQGNYIGFYLEPGVKIIAHKLEVNRFP